MKTCGKCLNFDFCKEYVTKGESFQEMPKGCPAFKRKPLLKGNKKGVVTMTDKKIPKAKCKKCKHCKLIERDGDIRCEYLSKNYSIWKKPKYCSNFEKIGGK